MLSVGLILLLDGYDNRNIYKVFVCEPWIMKRRIRYHYHVYGLIQGDGEESEKYVAEGPSSIVDVPIVLSIRMDTNLDVLLESLAGEVHENHLEYIDDQMRTGFPFDDIVGYIGFSFEPPCDNVIHRDKIYRTQRLSENEQKSFLEHMRKEIERSRPQT